MYAQSWYQVENYYFVSHHAKEYAEGLKPVAAVIQDESQKLADQSAK